MASQAAPASIPARLASALVSVAAALVILGVAIVPFFTPAWIHGEQDRAGVPALFGGFGDTAHGYSDQVVHDLLLGGDFVVPVVDKSCFGKTGACGSLLDTREQAHMRDVRAVFDELAVLILAGGAVVVVAARRKRGSAAARHALWRAVGRGARGLAVAMAAVGILSVVAFDAAFELFHELLFPPGSFSFDSATEQLVRLYPDQFWSDTALAVGAVALVVAIGVALVARRRTRAASSATPAPSAAATAGTASSLNPESVQ